MGGDYYFWLGASADADPATHEPSRSVSALTGECPLREQLRLECLKLAHDWGKLRFREGYSGIDLHDVTRKAAELYDFCVPVAA